MLDFIVIYLILITLFMSTLFPFLLLVLRWMDVQGKKLPFMTKVRIVLMPFSIEYVLWKDSNPSHQKRYRDWLRIGFIFSLITLIYLFVSAR